MDVEYVVDRLRAGRLVAMALDETKRRPILQSVERQLSGLGRTVLWVDMDGVSSGAELGSRIVEACLPYLDVEELGDILERLPARGRIDVEALAELLMLPEQVAEAVGRRVVAILDGFQALERVAGMPALVALRDTLMLRRLVAYLFVGNSRVLALFGRDRSPLYGLAEVAGTDPDAPMPVRPHPDPPASGYPPEGEGTDPLAAALLAWAEPPPAPKPKTQLVTDHEEIREAWRRLLEREAEEDDEERWDRRRRDRPRPRR